MTKNVYVLSIDAEWDMDYQRVFTSIDKIAQAIVEDFKDEYVFLDIEDVKNHIKEREEQGYIWLFFAPEIDDSIKEGSYCGSYRVQKCVLE